MEKLLDTQISSRLLVPVYSSQIDHQTLSNAIYSISEVENTSVLYLVIAGEKDDPLEIARDIATMKAVTAANNLSVDAITVKSEGLMDTLHHIAAPNDRIIDRNETTQLDGNLEAISLAEYLSNHPQPPAYHRKTVKQQVKNRLNETLVEIIGDVGFLVILAIFTWLQISFDESLPQTQSQIFVSISFCFEMASIWGWYRFIFK